MNILIVSATEFEVLPLLHYVKENFEEKEEGLFQKEEHFIRFLVTGVGPVLTAFHLGQFLGQYTVNIALNIGIAGAYNRALSLGSVVNVVSDRFADWGVEERDGSFTDVFEMELQDPNEAPFSNGLLYNKMAESSEFLPKASGLTVSKVHGSEESIEKIQSKYTADVETMEGAAFFYACQQLEVDCLQLRGLSNYVEPRNRDNWQIPQAIEAVNTSGIEIIKLLTEE